MSEDLEQLQEACGVFGVVVSGSGTHDYHVGSLISFGLLALQHRGQEGAGIVTSDGGEYEKMRVHKGLGLVSDVFTNSTLEHLNGTIGLGHTRYSTQAGTNVLACQPFVVESSFGWFALAHNGEILNCKRLRQKLLKRGIGLSTGSDSELIVQLLCNPSINQSDNTEIDWVTRIRNVMTEAPIAYSLLIMHGKSIYAVRDAYGNRPLCIGRIPKVNSTHMPRSRCDSATSSMSSHAPSDLLNYNRMQDGAHNTAFIQANNALDAPNDDTDAYVVASESCAFPSIGAKFVREIAPGEIVRIHPNGFESLCTVGRPTNGPSAFCVFEFVYFSRADSLINGQSVYAARQRCGEQLATESPVDADIVSCVPDSSMPAALGYSKVSGLPFVEIMNKSRYVHRTFIQPTKNLRQLAVLKKFAPLAHNVRNQRIVLLDDSIVRGNTMQPIVSMLRKAGAKEVHLRIASPPVKHPCYMGINIPTEEELIANHMNVAEIASLLGVDSLAYLSLEGLMNAVTPIPSNLDEPVKPGYCTACFTGKYPVAPDW